MGSSVTGQHQPQQKLPLKIGKVEVAEGGETPDDDMSGSRTMSGSGLWHFGRPDLIQWVPKLLIPGRNFIIGKSVKPVVVDGSDASQADVEKGAGLRLSKIISLRQALSHDG